MNVEGGAGSRRWIDNHCHLDPATGGRLVAEARAAGVGRIVNVGTDVTDSRRAVETARRFDGVWATAGVHPHDARQGLDGLEELLGPPGAIRRSWRWASAGSTTTTTTRPATCSARVFAAQIALAHVHDLALVIHTREAWDDTFAILASEGRAGPHRVPLLHRRSRRGRRGARARRAHLSFSGIVTFKNADRVREAAARCPLDRLLVETDAPYLAPVPHRGQPNRPAWVVHVGEAVAPADTRRDRRRDRRGHVRQRRRRVPPRHLIGGTAPSKVALV